MAAEKPRKVLIADDEPSMLSLVARHVRGLGYSVTEASDGDAAWQLAQQIHPDLVILDVMMPGMSGWEVCKRIKAPGAAETFASTGVIMLTGIGENLNDMTSALFAADTWLNKPFDFADLESRIHETLAKYQALPAGHEGGSHPQAPGASTPAKKTPAKKTAKKKTAAKKAVAKKAAAKRTAAKKTVAKKPAAKKPAAKKKTAAKKKKPAGAK
jgi:DNA-binding response OmpR family regulator